MVQNATTLSAFKAELTDISDRWVSIALSRDLSFGQVNSFLDR